MSQLTGNSKEERNAATLLVEIFEGTEGKPAGEFAAITQWVEGVRSVGSRHCWTRKNKREQTQRCVVLGDTLQERFGTNTGATCFNVVF